MPKTLYFQTQHKNSVPRPWGYSAIVSGNQEGSTPYSLLCILFRKVAYAVSGLSRDLL